MPTEEEYKKAEKKIEENHFIFDYVITHSSPTSIQKAIAPTYECNKLTDFLENIKKNVVCKKWFFGHYHKDQEVLPSFTAVFERVILL